MDGFLSTIVREGKIPNGLAETAQELLQEWRTKRKEQRKMDDRAYAVCALYVASITRRTHAGTERTVDLPSPTLSDILNATGVHIKSFFDWMGTVQTEVTLPANVWPSLKGTMQKYCVTSALYHKYQQLFKQIFILDDGSSTEGSEVSQGQPNRKAIGWTLFLIAKVSLGQASNELVTPLHLLICCIEYITKLSPAFLLQEPYNSAHYSQDTGDAILQVLCSDMGWREDVEEVTAMRDVCLMPVLHSIPQSRLNQGLECLPELAFLQQHYRELYRQAGDIDEDLFLDSESHLFVQKAAPCEPPGSPSGQPGNQASLAAMTPVKKAVSSVQSLKTLLSAASDAPSSPLRLYFKNCKSDPTGGIRQRISGLKDNYIHHFKRVMGSMWTSAALSRFQYGVRLYYRVLEAMLRKEEERLSTNDFSSLLLSDPFHKSLLACALEVVNVTYEYSPSEFPVMPGNASRLLFPWILDIFTLKAYDFGKVLESFMRDEPRLTQEARKHLQRIETRIVESMAWQTGSPLHDLIRTSDTIAEISSLTGSNGSSVPRTTAADMYLSPHRGATRALPSVSPAHPRLARLTSSPLPGSPVVSPRRTRSVSLNMFLNKVLQLAYGRLNRLASILNVSKDLEKFVWTCVEHCVANKADLMTNRHLDQIVMCCIFAICKVTDCELKFKDIVNAYRTLPHAEATTYRNVDIDGRKEDSIIMFYNQVFMPAMKSYILQFQPRNQQTPALSPAPSKSSSVSEVSPGIKVSQNLFISPLKESPFRSPHPVREVSFGSPRHQTPSKRTHYSFGEGPGSSEKLREINAWMKEASGDSRQTSRSSTSKRLKFEEEVPVSSLVQDEADGHTSNGIGSSAEGHVTSHSGEEPIRKQTLTPSMQQRVAMMTSERQTSRPSSQGEA